MTNIEAKDLYHYISTDAGATFKQIVCSTDVGFSSSRSSQETDTRCGVLTSTGNDTTTFTGTIVVDAAPDANELSFNELTALYLANTSFQIVQQNVLATTLLIGNGVITDISSAAAQGQFMTAQYTIKVSNLSQSHVS